MKRAFFIGGGIFGFLLGAVPMVLAIATGNIGPCESLCIFTTVTGMGTICACIGWGVGWIAETYILKGPPENPS